MTVIVTVKWFKNEKNVFCSYSPILSFTKGQHQSRGDDSASARPTSCQPDDGEALQVLEQRQPSTRTRGERRGQIESWFHLGFSCPQMG